MWSRSGRTLIGAVIVLQFLVPTIALLWDPPNRFGFQMYSALGGAEVTVLDADGRPLDVDVEDHLPVSQRNDLDYSVLLPAHLCRTIPEAASVRVTREDHTRSVTC